MGMQANVLIFVSQISQATVATNSDIHSLEMAPNCHSTVHDVFQMKPLRNTRVFYISTWQPHVICVFFNTCIPLGTQVFRVTYPDQVNNRRNRLLTVEYTVTVTDWHLCLNYKSCFFPPMTICLYLVFRNGLLNLKPIIHWQFRRKSAIITKDNMTQIVSLTTGTSCD